MSVQTIVYVAWAPFFSGAERALLVTLENLDPAHYRPLVVVGCDGELAQEVRSRKIPVVHIPTTYLGGRTAPIWALRQARLTWLARTAGAALIHSNDAPSFQPAGYAARWLGIPAVTHVRFPDTAAGFQWFLRPGFERALFVSAALQADAEGHAPALFAGRSDVVYDGVQTPALVDDAQRLRLREELGLPREGTLVVLAGQVAEIKGLWDYLDAAEQLWRRAVPVRFVVLGEDFKHQGEVRRKAESLVAARGMGDVVTFLGFKPNAQRLIPAFDIVAVPSHVEPLGNATLEAMASARPVVGARVGGIPEMVVDGVTGTLVPSRAPRALADALEDLIGAPDKAAAFGMAGRARAERMFSVRAHVDRVTSIYRRLIQPAVTT